MTKCLIIIMASTQNQPKFKCFPGRLKKVWQLWTFSQQELKYPCLLFGFSATTTDTFDASGQYFKEAAKYREAQFHCARYSQLHCCLNQWQKHDTPITGCQGESTDVTRAVWALFLTTAVGGSFAVGAPHFSLPICKMGIINYALHNRTAMGLST